MPLIDFDQLANEAQANLDTDPRFWNEEEGSFEWDGVRVFFTKLADWIVLDVEGIEIEVARP